MARRRRDLSPEPAPARDLDREYLWLARCGLFLDLYEAIRGERDRLDGLGWPVDRKVNRLREFIDELGYGDEADQFVAARAAGRERYRTGRA